MAGEKGREAKNHLRAILRNGERLLGSGKWTLCFASGKDRVTHITTRPNYDYLRRIRIECDDLYGIPGASWHRDGEKESIYLYTTKRLYHADRVNNAGNTLAEMDRLVKIFTDYRDRGIMEIIWKYDNFRKYCRYLMKHNAFWKDRVNILYLWATPNHFRDALPELRHDGIMVDASGDLAYMAEGMSSWYSSEVIYGTDFRKDSGRCVIVKERKSLPIQDKKLSREREKGLFNLAAKYACRECSDADYEKLLEKMASSG